MTAAHLRLDEEVSAIAAQEPRLNEEITVKECRLISYDGTQMGIVPIAKAQSIADQEGYDLVEIAPNADPVVCRVMDYGKFKYDQAIKAKQARKNQNKIETKEMKFRPKIDKGDYTTKKKHVLRFLEAGSKVKITIMFRGREMAHPEQGLSILERLAEDLRDFAVIETQPKMEGRNMHMLIAPLPSAARKKKESEQQGGTEAKPEAETLQETDAQPDTGKEE
ncbi:MAG: translation initiation factor IF-3 [Coriobacteriaceae bacterium]|jgi:translation initiation factor IF-3|nr:translation initiation factor IF-3 [Coriobacteriaceae bacterium]